MERQPGVLSGDRIGRREVLKRGLLGAAGLTLLPAVIAACKGSERTPTPTPAPPATPTPTPTPTLEPTPTPADFLARKLTGTLTVGSSYSDAAGMAGMQSVNDAFKKATGLTVTLNPWDSSKSNAQPFGYYYLTGTPDDLCTWFSGYQMRYNASKGWIAPIDDVWALVSSNFAPGFAQSVTGDDGKVYGIPTDFYPWAVFYRKSVWADKGYTIPTTWDELLALCARMQKDGLTPVAFADKDGWPAMGTFDILNLRLNGYLFHMDLLAGRLPWTDPSVTAVFEAWRKLIPFYTPGYAGLKWEQACDTLTRKQSGMYLLGTFLTDQVKLVDPSAVDDLDMFPFPYFGNGFDAEKALDAPVDIWMMPSRSPTLKADLVNVKAYLEFWTRGSTQNTFFLAQPLYLPTARDADTRTYSPLQKKAIEIVSAAQRITNFMDRDTRPDFAGANGMQSFLINFLENPGQDLAVLQKSIQAFWDKLPAQS
jgi:multiple sugar transport system substrate-binding protein